MTYYVTGNLNLYKETNFNSLPSVVYNIKDTSFDMIDNNLAFADNKIFLC